MVTSFARLDPNRAAYCSPAEVVAGLASSCGYRSARIQRTAIFEKKPVLRKYFRSRSVYQSRWTPLLAHQSLVRTLEIERAVRKESGRLLNFIRTRVRNEDDAEDILQEVFGQLIEAYRGLETIERVTAWLFQVARNKITDGYARASPKRSRARCQRAFSTQRRFSKTSFRICRRTRRHCLSETPSGTHFTPPWRTCRRRSAGVRLARAGRAELPGDVGDHGRDRKRAAVAETTNAQRSLRVQLASLFNDM